LSQFDELPEGWIETTLEELGKWSSGGTPSRKKSEYYGGEIPWIKTGDLPDGEIREADEFITDEGLKNSSAKIFPEGSLLVAMYGATIGKLGILKEPAATNQACAALLAEGFTEKLIPYAFYYLLNSREDLRKIGQGGAQPNISQTILKEYPCPLPPLNEQRRIVEKIEALTARSRKAREALEAIPELLDQFRQSVLAAAFRGDLTADWREQNPDVEPAEALLERIKEEDSLPFGWCTASLGSIIESLKYGTSRKCSYEENGVPVLRIPNVSEGMIKHDDIKYAELTDKEIQDLSLIPGDILLIRSNGSVSLVGKTALAKGSEQGFAYAGYLIRVRPNQQLVMPEYLDFCLDSYDLRMQIEVPARSTSGVHNINSKEVQKLQIPLAPLAEQKEIVRKILDFYSAVTQLESVFGETLVEHEQLDQSILAKAFRGELVPQDPNDEPAAVLLERIRAEREKVGKKSRR
jgi:type I restriction enzyme S subunit